MDAAHALTPLSAAFAGTPLAKIPSPTQSVWHIGGIPIRAYALCIVLGIIAACVVTEVRMRRRGAPANIVLDLAVWAVPFGILGARVYHILTSFGEYFGADGNPIGVFKIWEGGLGIWGAVAGGAIGAYLACRRLGIPLRFAADAMAPALPLAQAIGRLGNWFNNELYGRRTSVPWAVEIHDWDSMAGKARTAATESGAHEAIVKGLYQPTFLYEGLWDIGVAVLVWQLDRRYRFGRGRAFALYVMAYCVGRFWVEAMRTDPSGHFLGLRLNNWTAILVLLGALIYFVRVRGPQERLVVANDGSITVLAGEGEQAVADLMNSAEASGGIRNGKGGAAGIATTVDGAGIAATVDGADAPGEAGESRGDAGDGPGDAGESPGTADGTGDAASAVVRPASDA